MCLNCFYLTEDLYLAFIDMALTKHDFEKEVKKLALNRNNIKPASANNAVNLLFKKYYDLIACNTDSIQELHDRNKNLQRIINVLKTGVIDYKDGSILTKDVEQVEINQKHVLLTTRTGRQITLNTDFTFLSMVFSGYTYYQHHGSMCSSHF